MSQPITSFRGQYKFLSNFAEGGHYIVGYDGDTYRTVEHAYQAAKCACAADRALFRIPGLTPGQAKRMGREVRCRKDWDDIKIGVMLTLLRSKFRDPVLRKLLLDTGDCALIEGNNWGDFFWGVCGGVGKNMLGKCLMAVRSEFGGPPVDFEIELMGGKENA